jgi:hypothetical protein
VSSRACQSRRFAVAAVHPAIAVVEQVERQEATEDEDRREVRDRSDEL